MILKDIPTDELINELASRKQVEWRRFVPLKENFQPLIELCEAKNLTKDDLELIVNSIARVEYERQ